MSELRVFVEHPDDAPWEPSVIHCGEFNIREARDGALLIEDIGAAVQRMLDDECELMSARSWFRAKLLAAAEGRET